MKEQIEDLISEAEGFNDALKVEEFRIRFLGKKGVMGELFARFKDVPGPEKKEIGQLLNKLKTTAENRIEELKSSSGQTIAETSGLDLTRPAKAVNIGARHPISVVMNQIIGIFKRIGFTVSEGPEMEDDWHNFTALNIPQHHPARDMQDTFFLAKNPDQVLRTHTSSVQIRYMENHKPPIRTISPGRVFRNEDISARSHCIFHQVEGLYVDKNVSFADLKQTLLYFAKAFFGKDVEIRLRPSYFPFTEPSAEVDVSCSICKGDGCNVCKYTGWLEIMGCGMVDPAVLENCGIDPNEYSGYAFGMGVERPAMLKYGVNDIRLFFENDIRFLDQFKSAY